MKALLWISLSLATTIFAQTCENYGIANGDTCSCPTGFGGPSCSEVGCQGNIFEGRKREFTETSSGFANLTVSGCGCDDGWGGLGCNVCQTSGACQSGLAANGGVTPTAGTLGDLQNHTMVCSTGPRVWAAGQMSCDVNNPTLQSIYPGRSVLNIERTLNPDLSPIPGSTSFGSAGSAFVQLLYDGVEQFYCQANSCLQTGKGLGINWKCQNLQCTCRPNTSFCGAVVATNLTATINALDGTLEIDCTEDKETGERPCHFVQSTLQNLFGLSGLALNGCTFGECVRQSVIDSAPAVSGSEEAPKNEPLGGGVIAGLAVVGGLVLLALLFLLWGFLSQRAARKKGYVDEGKAKVGVSWSNLTYYVPHQSGFFSGFRKKAEVSNGDKFILDNISGNIPAGQMMAILGPSGAGKTTLIEILAGKSKSGITTGDVSFPFERTDDQAPPRIGFVPQQDILPSTLTVFETLLFATRLRLSESISDIEKKSRVNDILEKLGISHIKDTRIGDVTGGKARGISGGEMRRVTIGLELISSPDVLFLDEPTSGLDSVSAARIANVLHAIAHDPVNPIAVIASIHQPSSILYQKFDSILLLAHGRALYSGPGGFEPVTYFSRTAPDAVPAYNEGHNIAEYLLEVASDPPVALFTLAKDNLDSSDSRTTANETSEKPYTATNRTTTFTRNAVSQGGLAYATTFLTQLQYLCGREWKTLKRDRTLFLTHVIVAAVLGVFCGGLYYQTGITISGFQSRVGCLFFLGALVAFSSLSALYNMVEIRPLFLRERSGLYYSPTAWLLSRFFFDMIPLRLIPTIVVSTITYWMAGLAPDAPHFFKFLFILVLYSLAMTLFNFLLGTFFQNGGIAILLSALSALFQMTYAGFFVNLSDIPPVLRWLQWVAPLKYMLEALAVNEVDSGLMIEDTLQGVPVSVSAALIMQLLFGFGLDNYYRDVLILFGFIAGFGVGVIGVVWFFVRERR
ncbi:ABC transporter [Coprinopsis marcescibilis]|uniref:ABC transporter n=1 Tax=Coprinopsis marcescibilis TaxID=230819 RepID=A0A5C3KZQ6_COPMA|nr:ABC transporter [Coprinopsis marcescibilis]